MAETGQQSTYDLTVGVKLEIEDLIYVLTPTDVPILGTFNGTDTPAGPQRSILGRESVSEKKIEWLEEELLPPRTDIATAGLAGDTFITVTAGEREHFMVGDTIRVNNEVMRITAYGTTANTLVVTRGFAGTTAAAVAVGDDVVGTGTSLPEGSDPGDARFRDRTTQHNFTEIFGPDKIDLSGTEMVVAKYGVASEWDHQVANRVREQNIAIEQAILYGQRNEDTTNRWRSLGGATFYITTNVNSTTTDITEAALLDQYQNSYNDGGVVDLLIVGPGQKRKISAFNADVIRLQRSDRVRGQIVDTFESDFAVSDVLLDRHVRSSDLFGADKQYWSLAVLRPQMLEILAKTGDSQQAMIVCEKSFKLRLQRRHFRFSALT